MDTQSPATRNPAARLREARRKLLDTGGVAAGLIDPGLSRSWQRSRDFGLAPTGRAPGAPHASAPQLARLLERQGELVAHARPVMEYLFDHTRDTDSMVILADAQGLLLRAMGDATFIDRAQRVTLRAGASWSEQWRGTNAIGTALAEAAPVVVQASEHYLHRNGFLTCTAAPIMDSCGRMLGVLDISVDHRGYHPHTQALVRSAARMIEHRLFNTHHAGHLRVRLHEQPEGIGTVTEGLLAVTDDGRLIGADAAARHLIGLGRVQATAPTIEHVLQLDPATLHAWAVASAAAPHPIHRHDGSLLWARVEGHRPLTLALTTAGKARSTEPVPCDPLADLDTGDPSLRVLIQRARRVLDKPISLLMRGESGVGKEVFARALHASSSRRTGPFVAVNCAALPEALIEAELFGYRPGAFTGACRDGAPGRVREAHGGTLFLDEIGDMPAPLQARLLRVLQDRQVLPLGGGKPVPVDFRLICATHRNLRDVMDAGRFRADLYYRLNGLTLELPPLRERQDTLHLIERWLRDMVPDREVRLAPDVALAVSRHRWPANLRQLHNTLQTACALIDDSETRIDWTHLPDDLLAELRSSPGGPTDADAGSDLRLQSEQTVKRIVQSCPGNLSEAARRLGISRNTLYRKLGELGLR